MISHLYQWIDLLWLPVAMVTVHKGQRALTAVFMLVCIFSMRAQVELMQSFGRPGGFTGLLQAGAYERGLVVYGIVFTLFLILAYFSPHTKGVIFLAATLTIYILSFCLSMLVMAI